MKKTIFTQLMGVVLCCLCLMTKATANDINLCTYQPASDIIPINGIPGDLSGVTYNPLTNTLFMVVNKSPNDGPPFIYETQPDGILLRTISLSGFDDIEGIVHIGGTEFALTDEDTRRITFIDIFPTTTSITASNDYIQLPNDLGPWGSGSNKSLEGVSYNPATNTIYSVKEGDIEQNIDKGFYAFERPATLPTTLNIADVDQLCNIAADASFDDLAGMHHLGLTFTGSTDVLLLSEASKTLVHLDENCNEIGRLSLNFMNQPEGVTMDNNGNIYIVGEPNQLVILSSDPSLEVDADNSGTPDACETCSLGSAGKGDVNGDGETNILDAYIVSRYAVDLIEGGDCGSLLPATLLCLPRADMDCNGEVTIVDAYHIAGCAVGLPSEFCPD